METVIIMNSDAVGDGRCRYERFYPVNDWQINQCGYVSIVIGAKPQKFCSIMLGDDVSAVLESSGWTVELAVCPVLMCSCLHAPQDSFAQFVIGALIDLA